MSKYIYPTKRTTVEVYDYLHSGNTYGLHDHGKGMEVLIRGSESLLDIGCGRTEFAARVERELDLKRIAVCDISPVAVEYQKQHYGIPDAFVYELPDTLPYDDNEFDLVTSLDVLEHLPRDVVKPAIEEMARVAFKRLLFTIAHKQARHFGPGRERLHLTLEPIEWWLNLLSETTGGRVRTQEYVRIKRGKPYEGRAVIVDL